MVNHIMRDFASSTSGYDSAVLAAFFTPQIYTVSQFLNKVLGYSIVGQTGWDINNTNVQTFTATATTPIAAGSNGAILPQTTINVTSTTGFPSSGTIYVSTSNGVQIVKYVGTTVNSFLNCTGGTGTMTAGQATTIAVGSNNVALPTGTINVASTTGFATSGTIFVVTTSGVQTVAYTNTTGTSFTGCTGGIGTMNTGNAVTSAGGAVACSPLIATGAGTSPPTITTNFPHGLTTGQIIGSQNNSGAFPAGPFQITVLSPTTFVLMYYSATVTGNGTIYPPGMVVASGTVSGGTGASINVTGANSVYAVSIPQSVRTVVAGAAPAAGDSGRLLVLKSTKYPTKNSGIFKISAVNTGNSTTIAAASTGQSLPQSTINVASTTGFPASGTIFVFTSTGVQTVTYTGGGGGGTTFTGCSGGTGTMTTGNTVNNFNGYTIDYRSSDTPPPETMDWWLLETEVQVSRYLNWPNQNRINVGLLSTTNTAPIQCTANVNVQMPLLTGMRLNISGVTGNTNANGNWTITVPSPTTSTGVFFLNGSVGNGTSGSVGSIVRLGYAGDGYAINSKIILQSPHSTGWQVRLCAEPWNVTGAPNCSMAVGYGGTSTGDFTIGGTHTHVAQFLDSTFSGQYANTSTGNAQQGVSYRLNIAGDDGGQFVALYARTQAGGSNGLIVFGIPDNEPSPTAPNTNRPFIWGPASTTDMGGIQFRWGSANNVGFTYRDANPEMCGIAAWANADGVSGTSPTYSTNAGDCPFTGTTEVLPLEVWGGIATDIALNLPYPTAGYTVYGINQRFMGTLPLIRQGRTNFGTFTLSTDNTASFSITNATNTSPIQITTSAANALATGQTVVISGVGGNTAANGTFVVTVVDTTHFNLNGTTGNGTYTVGGSGNGTSHWLHLQNGIYLQWNGASGLTP